MKTLTLTHAKALINWFATEGQSNWGVWGNYPALPVAARYHSFDTCPVRVLLSETVEFEGMTFNCLANSRNVPGKEVESYIYFSELKTALQAVGITFVEGSYMTLERATEITNSAIEHKKEVVKEFQQKYTYEWCLDKVTKEVDAHMTGIRLNKEFGQRIPESITGFELTIKNYCEKGSIVAFVDLELTGTNSKKTCGHYKVVSEIDKQAIIEQFAAEKFASYSYMRKIHEAELSEMLA